VEELIFGDILLEVLLYLIKIIELYGKYIVIFGIPIVVNNSIVKIDSKLSLQKFKKYEECFIFDSNLIIAKINNLKIKNNFSDEQLIPLLEKLKQCVLKSDLKIIYSKLENLKIKYQKTLRFIGIKGEYSVKENELRYSSLDSFGHELLHIASSIYDEESDIKLSGFRQFNEKVAIGTFLNEGYTELLASRIFYDNKILQYEKSVRIAEILECFFDDPKDMMHLYFNCNLPGFIKHMEKYTSRNEIINLILEIDKIEFHSNLIGPFKNIDYIRLQLKLYKLFVSKNNDSKKLKKLRQIINKDKLILLLLDKQMKLCRKVTNDIEKIHKRSY